MAKVEKSSLEQTEFGREKEGKLSRFFFFGGGLLVGKLFSRLGWVKGHGSDEETLFWSHLLEVNFQMVKHSNSTKL